MGPTSQQCSTLPVFYQCKRSPHTGRGKRKVLICKANLHSQPSVEERPAPCSSLSVSHRRAFSGFRSGRPRRGHESRILRKGGAQLLIMLHSL